MKDRDNLKVELDKFNPLFGKEDDSLAHYSLNELQALERQVKMALERIEKAKQNLEEEKLCVICRENPKVMLIMPCRHLCVCEECGHRVELDRCPLCRNVIAERFSVFS
jgi:E3 ubiquitin-protein ligase MUL1